MLIAALAVLLADPTVAQDPPPAPPPSVIRLDPQIQSWLDRSPSRSEGERGPIWDDGRVHGEVSVSVGTGGWRSWGGEVSTPLGREGRLTLNYRKSESDDWRGWGEGPYEPYWRGGLGADDRPLHGPDRRD